MTPAAALYQFFANAIPGWSAYAETSVPSIAAGDAYDATFPYMTYHAPMSFFNSERTNHISVSINLWHYDTSEKVMNDAALALADAIGLGGITLPCDRGVVTLYRGDPFDTPMSDADNPKLKRRYINAFADWSII